MHDRLDGLKTTRFKLNKSERIVFLPLFYFKRDKLRERHDLTLRTEEFINGIAFALMTLIRADLEPLGLNITIKSLPDPNTLKIRIFDETHSETKKVPTGDFIFAEDPKMLLEDTITELTERILEARNDSN